MYLIRFLDFLDEWRTAKSFKKLSGCVLNDCTSNDGDLSFFLINDYNGNFYTADILKAVCRYAFNNFKKWEDVKKENGAVFLPRKKVDKIKKVDEDPPGALNTIHCNMEDVILKESRKLEKLIYKHRKHSCYYTLSSLEKVIRSLNKEDWDSLFSLAQTKYFSDIAHKIKKEFFRGKNHPAPKELLAYIEDN